MSPTDGDLAGLHVVPDPSAERREDGTVLVGGSPMRLLRLRPAGARLVERLWQGEAVPAGEGATALASRLLDAGLVHPDWRAGALDRPAAPSPVEVTVVIPVRGMLAPGLLDGLGAVAAVVVVDDASREPILLPRRNAHGVPVQVVRHATRQGPGAARTTGLAHVDSTLVAFVDADCMPEPGWLDELLPHLADPAVAAVAPRITAADPAPSGLLARYEAACSALDMGPRPARVRARSRVGHVPSAALVARADVVRELGGFDPTLATGEDVDLVWRLDEAGWTVRYEPGATVAHHHRTSARAWARRRADYGAAAGPLARRHPEVLAPLEVPVGGRAERRAALVAAGASPALADELLAQGRRALVRQLARALLRPWWPVTAVAMALVPRRLRRWMATGVLAAATGAALRDWVVERPAVDPATFVVGRLADDVAYSAGVWRSSLAERTAEPLLPLVRRTPRPALASGSR